MEPTVVLLVLAGLGFLLFKKDDDQDQDDGGYGQRFPRGRFPDGSMNVMQPPQYGAPSPAPPYAPPPMAPPVAAPPRMPPRPAPQPIPPSDELMHAGSSLYSMASSPGASCAAIAGVTAVFQQQAVTDGHHIVVDGKYGPGTVALLDSVLVRQGLRAPADLWGPGRRCHTAAGARPPLQGAPGDGVGTHAEQVLRDQMGGPIHAGDAYLASSDYNGAVESFKAAGHAGVLSVGPTIDGQTRGRSVSATRKAWLLNGDLAKINSKQFNGRSSTPSDAYRAQNLAHQMFDTYAQALGVAPQLTAGFSTGLGTVIPSMYKKAACFDAQGDMQMCAAVAAALAHETDPSRLQSFGQSLLAQYPMAGTALIGKANMILGGYRS